MPIQIIPSQPTNDPKNLYFTEDQVVTHIKAMVTLHPSDGYTPNSEPYSPFVNTVLMACAEAAQRGRKIQAIRLLRVCFPIGLKEAKDYIEANYPY